MNGKRWLGRLGCLAISMVVGCGADTAPPGNPMTACTAQKGFCATLTVPADYQATPVKLIVGLYKKLDATGPAGPPDAIALQQMNPTISPAAPFAMEPTDLTVSGSYYVYAALYNQGGGMFVPVKGIDYVTQTTSPIDVGGTTSPNLGTLLLTVAK